ncbi:hypothetical protein F5Y18DRAFT_441701 [Xylariaceae sp. FL1019]|nr:hypothetical protein F5Y18DRAFT_441701 [Xylariaceae sp. FL1019]
MAARDDSHMKSSLRTNDDVLGVLNNERVVKMLKDPSALDFLENIHLPKISEYTSIPLSWSLCNLNTAIAKPTSTIKTSLTIWRFNTISKQRVGTPVYQYDGMRLSHWKRKDLNGGPFLFIVYASIPFKGCGRYHLESDLSDRIQYSTEDTHYEAQSDTKTPRCSPLIRNTVQLDILQLDQKPETSACSSDHNIQSTGFWG